MNDVTLDSVALLTGPNMAGEVLTLVLKLHCSTSSLRNVLPDCYKRSELPKTVIQSKVWIEAYGTEQSNFPDTWRVLDELV